MITKETKMRLATMLVKRSLIVVGRRINRLSSVFDYKFIAAVEGLRWDMTPVIISLSKCREKDGNVREYCWQVVLERAIKQMNNEGISFFDADEYEKLLNGVAFFEM